MAVTTRWDMHVNMSGWARVSAWADAETPQWRYNRWRLAHPHGCACVGCTQAVALVGLCDEAADENRRRHKRARRLAARLWGSSDDDEDDEGGPSPPPPTPANQTPAMPVADIMLSNDVDDEPVVDIMVSNDVDELVVDIVLSNDDGEGDPSPPTPTNFKLSMVVDEPLVNIVDEPVGTS